jgi:hypothetical protein
MASLVASDEVVGAVVDAAPVVAVDAMNVEKRQLRQNRGGQVEEENEEKEKNDTQECPFEFPAVEVVGDLLTVLILCTLKSEALVHVVSQQRRIAGRGRKGEEENEYRRTGPSSQVRATWPEFLHVVTTPSDVARSSRSLFSCSDRSKNCSDGVFSTVSRSISAVVRRAGAAVTERTAEARRREEKKRMVRYLVDERGKGGGSEGEWKGAWVE